MDNSEIKYYQSLLDKKHRKEEKKFLAEGKRLVLEGIESNSECEIIIFSKEFADSHQDIYDFLNKKELRIEILKQDQYRKLTETKTSQGIIAAFKYDTLNNLEKLDQNLIIALENISDPGNLGTIIRNCDWFGIKEIMLGENCAELYNPKVIRSTMGSVFHIKFFNSRNLISDLVLLKRNGYKIVCTDMDGKSIYNLKLPAKSILLFSSEATGPSKELLDITDSKITIPKFGQAESLNVASASAVTLAELLKTK